MLFLFMGTHPLTLAIRKLCYFAQRDAVDVCIDRSLCFRSLMCWCSQCDQMLEQNLARLWAGALVWWLWEETHVLKVVCSNPSTVYWMDIFSNIFVAKIVRLKGSKINVKEAENDPFLLKVAQFLKNYIATAFWPKLNNYLRPLFKENF